MAEPWLDRSVRKELLRGRAAMERLQAGAQWQALRTASRPSQWIKAPWTLITGRADAGELASQAWTWVRRYRVWAPLLTMLLTRRETRPRRGIARRVLPLGLAAWLGWQAWQIWEARQGDSRNNTSGGGRP